MKLKKNYTLLKIFIALALVLLAAGCGTDGGVGSGNADTGAITAKLNWSDDTSSITDKLNWIGDTSPHILSAPVGVVTVRIIVSGTGMSDVQKDFAAAVGQGTVDNIPAGSSRTVTAKGLDASGNAIAQGAISNITIVAGQTTDAGTITMQPLITLPSTPTGFAVNAASSSQINLSWNASTGATGYKIYKGGSLLKSVTTTSTSDTGLSPSTNYCYSVAASNSAGDSTQTSQVCATTPTAPPPPTTTGTWRVLGRCMGASYDVWDLLIYLNETAGGNFSGSASGTDYSGIPMQMSLTGNYNNTSKFISLTATTTSTAVSCVRMDTMSTTLTSNDTGYITATQTQVCGCTAQYRMIKQ